MIRVIFFVIHCNIILKKSWEYYILELKKSNFTLGSKALEIVIIPIQKVAKRNRGLTFNRGIMAIESQPVSMPQYPLGQRVVLFSTVIIRLCSGLIILWLL